ncbi:MAG: MFS transporter [Rubrivivax sp.]|nr:MFS transporter [Rubrivivax sp.]
MRACDPMLLALAAEFGRGLGDVSRVVSVFAIAYGALQLFYGPLGDRVGKLRVVAFACTGCAAAAALAAFAPSLEMLVAARALMGATAAGIVPMTIAWIGDSVPYEQRQETLARLLGATVGGMVVGLWFGGWITEVLGWRHVFGLLALVFAAAAVPLWRRPLADRAGPGDVAPSGLRHLLRLPAQPRVRWVLSVVAIEGALMFGMLAFVPAFLGQRHGLGTGAAGAVLALFGVGGLLYSRVARRLLRALGERGMAAGGGALVGIALVVLAWAPHWAAALPACLFAGAGFYMLHNTLQTQATQMAPAQRGSAVALFACLLFLGQSAGVAVVSIAVDGGAAAWAFTACAVGLALLGGVVSRGVGRGADERTASGTAPPQ